MKRFPLGGLILALAGVVLSPSSARAQVDAPSTGADTKVEVRVQIDAAPDTVWRTLTNPRLVKQWHLGLDTETDWRVGSRLLRTGLVNKKAHEAKGIVLASDRPKRLVHTQWSPDSGLPDRPQNYRTVRYELIEAGQGTELTIIEENILSEAQRVQTEAHWQKAVRGLKAIAERRRSSE